MLILALRTDKPEAEIELYDDATCLASEVWTAHRLLAETLHQKILRLLEDKQYRLQDVQGIVCYKGPGSFTGLRIGLSVANALAYGLEIPVVSTQGDQWQEKGIKLLRNGENEKIALPEYGAPVFTTKQKK
jgi:tRNA threonylcarbamoyladenosine biosynthesis protein TsaB